MLQLTSLLSLAVLIFDPDLLSSQRSVGSGSMASDPEYKEGGGGAHSTAKVTGAALFTSTVTAPSVAESLVSSLHKVQTA